MRGRSFVGLTGAWIAVASTFPFVASGLSAQEDNPFLRWRFFMEQRAYPAPLDVGLAGRLQDALRVVENRGIRSAPPSALGAVGPAPWMPIGPERILRPFELNATGRTSALALDPRDPDVIYVGGAQGGVWKTVDGGASWASLTDDQCSLAMGSIALDPENPDIVYAGTGEQHFSGDSYYGCGLLRSTDGGATWTRLGVAEFTRPGGAGARISRVVIDPATAGSTTSTTVYVASDFGLFRSTDSGLTWVRTFSQTATDIGVDPDDPTLLHLGAFGSYNRSTDGGLTWDPVGLPTGSASEGRVNLAVAPSDGDIVYASVHDRDSGSLVGIFKSEDAGATWTEAPAVRASCGGQCWYDMALAVDPTDPDVVYFGGINLFRSDNGGDSFFPIMGAPSIHVDQHLIVVDERAPATVYVTNDGGVYRSEDRGGTWETLNTDLSLTQFYGGISIHPENPDDMLGGTQDNGTLGYEGTLTWPRVVGGDGGFTAIDPTDPDIRYAETQWGGGFSGPRRSDDGGGFFPQKVVGIDLDDDGIFIPPLVMDPFEPTVLYFGTERLYRTENRAESWNSVSPSFSPAELTAIAPSRSDGDVVYVATNRGDVHVTQDGGESWTDVSAGLPNRFFRDLAVHPTEPGTAWLAVSGFGSGHVFRSDDFGATWADVSGDLPDHPVNAILLDPGDPDQVVIGTDLGIFVSDGGLVWERFDDGLPTVAVFDLAVEPNAGVLVAATHGRGMYTVPAEAPLELAVRRKEIVETLLQVADPLTDSLRVGVFGTGWPDAMWNATHGDTEWLRIDRVMGQGRSHLVWTLDPEGLAPGTYVDTITVDVPGAEGTPCEIVVEFTVEKSELNPALDDDVGRGETVEGLDGMLAGSAALTIDGLGADTAQWTATHGGSDWLEIVTKKGAGPGEVQWTRDPSGLAPGTYIDTIRVRLDSDPMKVVELVDTLIVEPPVVPESAIEALLGVTGALTSIQRDVLDRVGNDDGIFNLGDVLAWIARCDAGDAACVQGEPSESEPSGRDQEAPMARKEGGRP